MSSETNSQRGELPITPEQEAMEAGLELTRAALDSPEGQGQRQQLVKKIQDSLETSGLVVLDLEKPPSNDERRSKSGLTRQQALDIIELNRKRPGNRLSRGPRLGYNR